MNDRERRTATRTRERSASARGTARNTSSRNTSERSITQRGNAPKRKRRKRQSKTKKFLKVLVISLIVICCILGISLAVGKYVSNNLLFGGSQEEIQIDMNADSTVVIEVPQGASTKKIAELLKDNGIITNELTFRLSSRLNGADGTYNYGKFYLNKDMSMEQIIKTLQQKTQAEAVGKLTVPEGYTVKQIAALVDEMGIAAKDEFLNEVNNGEFDYEFLKDIPKRDNYLEGYLFPDTYFLDGTETARDIIVMMLDRFNQVYIESIKPFVESSSYSLDDLVIIASMIESETRVDEERPTVAGVIYNRLKIDMPLQIDSTVQYALSTRNEVVTYTDLTVDSPYNTYKNYGLPVGPICSPGKAALVAAVQPESHNYLYYVLKEQGGKYHTFCENYNDFLNAKAKYQATFN